MLCPVIVDRAPQGRGSGLSVALGARFEAPPTAHGALLLGASLFSYSVSRGNTRHDECSSGLYGIPHPDVGPLVFYGTGARRWVVGRGTYSTARWWIGRGQTGYLTEACRSDSNNHPHSTTSPPFKPYTLIITMSQSQRGKQICPVLFPQALSADRVDYIRDLNNYLQSHPDGNLTSQLTWTFSSSGLDHQKTHHAVARRKSINHSAECALSYHSQRPGNWQRERRCQECSKGRGR